MNEIAADAGATKEQVDQAMKLARVVLNKKEDNSQADEVLKNAKETDGASENAKVEENVQIEEEQLD